MSRMRPASGHSITLYLNIYKIKGGKLVHIIKLVGKDNALFQNLTRQFKSAKLTVIFIALKLCATQIAEIQSF